MRVKIIANRQQITALFNVLNAIPPIQSRLLGLGFPSNRRVMHIKKRRQIDVRALFVKPAALTTMINPS